MYKNQGSRSHDTGLSCPSWRSASSGCFVPHKTYRRILIRFYSLINCVGCHLGPQWLRGSLDMVHSLRDITISSSRDITISSLRDITISSLRDITISSLRDITISSHETSPYRLHETSPYRLYGTPWLCLQKKITFTMNGRDTGAGGGWRGFAVGDRGDVPDR